MLASSIHTRLAALIRSLEQTQQLISRLSKLPSQPGNPSAQAEADPRQELRDEIHQSLKDEEEDYELLRQDAEDYADQSTWSSSIRRIDSDKDKEKIEIAARVTKLGEDLKIARVQFRKAQLTAKRNAEAAKRKERELLFAGLEEPEDGQTAGYGRRKAQEKLSQDDIVLGTSNDIITSLRRTHNLMSAELERSQFARETLENSTKELTSLSESYSNLDTLLSSSRSLVSTLITSQKSDTWYLESAFYILCCTIGWLVFRRIIYGPGWWLLYFPLRLLFRSFLLTSQLLVGALSAAAGTIGATGQSKALEQASANIGSSLAKTPTARGKAGIPTFEPNMPVPSMRSGAGGQGAKMENPLGGEKSLSDKVGEMARDTQQQANTAKPQEGQETLLREREVGEQPNPKKRMWEEPVGDVAQGKGPRDEL